MQKLILELLKLSITGSLLAIVVMLIRLLLRKAPKWLLCALWGMVALRLICPVSFESSLSLVPDRWASGQIISEAGNMYIGEIDFVEVYDNNAAVGSPPVASFATEAGSLQAPKTIANTVFPILGWVWLAGMILMLAYAAVSYFVLHNKMDEATRFQNNIWQCERVDSPFVLGLIKPRIYLPYAITEEDMAYVIAHEQAHIRRKDHWWKPLGFILLSVHWFNPILWVAYILLCRDIEAACDEKVIKNMEKDEKRAYSTALLRCSVHRRRIAACPLAFGEVGVKARVKSVMNYKKPAFWVVVIAVLTGVAVAVCFLTNPTVNVKNPWVQEYVPGAQGMVGSVNKAEIESIHADFAIGADQYGRAVFKNPTKAFYTFISLYADGIAAIQKQYDLAPISVRNYGAYKTYGWQTTADTDYIREQASFVTVFLDIYENSFSSEIPVANPEIRNTFTTALKVYYELTDGTWLCDGVNYQFRLVISGRMHEAAIDSTFVYLSNLETITYDQAWKAAGLSSNINDYFPKEDAVLVDWYSRNVTETDIEHTENQTTNSPLGTAISIAILERNSGDIFPVAPGDIHTHSYRILAFESVSGTPVVDQDNPITEVTAYIIYLYTRYNYSGIQLETQGSISTPAVITFSVDDEQYTVKEFWEPNPGATFDAEIREKFPPNVEGIYFTLANKSYFSTVMQQECYAQATEYLAKTRGNMEARSPYIDSISYDIDGDGKEEICTVHYGPTSGFFSIILCATPKEELVSVPKYVGTYALFDSYNLSFVVEDGVLMLKGEDPENANETVYIEVMVKDGSIVLYREDGALWFTHS